MSVRLERQWNDQQKKTEKQERKMINIKEDMLILRSQWKDIQKDKQLEIGQKLEKGIRSRWERHRS